MVKYQELPSPAHLKDQYPLLQTQQAFVEKTRAEISRILNGQDSRRLMIVGPCSIHDIDSTKEYARRLKCLSDEVADQFLLVMRTYFEKPRTALGWKGFLYDPHLNGSHDIECGLIWTRQLLLDLLTMEVPTAAELLGHSSAAYLADLLSWGCIGARTVASQSHRQMASSLMMPIAFKNTTEGSLEPAIHGIVSCSRTHAYIGISQDGKAAIVQSKGNPDAHLVLRGSDHGVNYDKESIFQAMETLKKADQPLRLLVDCSHGNSKRKHEQQREVFQSVFEQIVEGNQAIKGILLESHLNAGNQQLDNPNALQYAVSITDPCLDWESTESLIRWAYAQSLKV